MCLLCRQYSNNNANPLANFFTAMLVFAAFTGLKKTHFLRVTLVRMVFDYSVRLLPRGCFLNTTILIYSCLTSIVI